MNSIKKKLQIGIVWANPYNKNMGVAALAYSILFIFKDLLGKRGIDAEITFIGSSNKGLGRVIVKDLEYTFNNMHGIYLIDWKSILRLIIYPDRLPTSKLFKFDYVFDMAEGDSFTDIYGGKRFTSILNTKKLFNLLGKKQILLPQTIGPFNDVRREKRAIKVMKKMKKIICRDQTSYDYTTSFLSNRVVEESIDVAFYLPYEKRTFNSNKINVGLNISGLLWNGGYTRNNQFRLKTNYRRLIHNILGHFTTNGNVQVYLVPHVIPDNNPVEDDYEVSQIIAQTYSNVKVSNRFTDPIEAKSYISGLDFFIGSRMHSCIAAFSTDVPVFPIAYSRKFNGLFNETLNYEVMGDCIHQNETEIMGNLEIAFKQRNKLKSLLVEANCNIVKDRLERLKEIIFEAIQ